MRVTELKLILEDRSENPIPLEGKTQAELKDLFYVLLGFKSDTVFLNLLVTGSKIVEHSGTRVSVKQVATPDPVIEEPNRDPAV